MTRVETAESLFRQGFACSQALLAAHAADHGLPVEQALRLGEGFAAGLCGLGRTCGAVTGAILVIGLAHGRIRSDDHAARDATAERVRRLVAGFERRHGTSACQDLLGFPVDTPEKRQQARDAGVFMKLCPQYVRTAAELLEEILP